VFHFSLDHFFEFLYRCALSIQVREVTRQAQGVVLEPIMSIEVTAPTEFQGNIVSNLNRRRAVIQGSDVSASGSDVVIKADVPLAQMFGYSTDLRSSTQGKGEFAMEYKSHESVSKESQEELISMFKAALVEEKK